MATETKLEKGLQSLTLEDDKKQSIKIVSWNVNGLAGIQKKDVSGKKFTKLQAENPLSNLVKTENPDILCLQEIRCSAKLKYSPFPYTYTSYAEKKGYSGTLISCKKKPSEVTYGVPGIEEKEGRVITLEFEGFYFINVYAPNSGDYRLKYRTETWEPTMKKYLIQLQEKKKVVLIGDLNCIPEDIDISKFSKKIKGGSPEEKKCFSLLLKDAGLIDTFRDLHPKERKYSWLAPWAPKMGCRLDFCLVSSSLKDNLKSSEILGNTGSDHLPISVELSF
jgi:exodeoxyribonuclease-3